MRPTLLFTKHTISYLQKALGRILIPIFHIKVEYEKVCSMKQSYTGVWIFLQIQIIPPIISNGFLMVYSRILL
jgi:hypothetical protein